MKTLRKVYNMNPVTGNYPAIGIPPEMVHLIKGKYVCMEDQPDGSIVIRSVKVTPR